MSKEVDSRVVEMQFDNKQFESNVKTSMSTLEKLKKSLKLEDSAKGFDNIDKAAKKVDMSGLSSAVDTVKVKFSALQVVAMTALQNMTNSAINAGKRMASAVTNPIVEGGKNRALNIEQAKFQFEGLGIAVEEAMASANAAVKGTAYGLDAAAKVASQFAASGMKAGEDMTSSLRAVAGVAAMTGSSYEDIGHIFTTVAGNGRLMGDELLQLSGRGINAAATLAKALGKTESQIRDMVSKGKISFETFYKAMDEAFGQHAKDANKTFNGALSNMKAALSRIGADVATPAFQDLRDVFNALTPVIDKVHTALGPLIGDIEKAMKTASEFAVGKLNVISEKHFTSGWENLKNQVSATGAIIDDFQNGLIETARSHGIAIDDMIAKEGSFENTLKSGWLTSGILSETLQKLADGLFSTSKQLIDFESIVNKVINGDFGNGAERINKLTEAGYDYATVQGLVNDVLRGNTVDFNKLSDAQLKNIGYTEEQISAIRELAKQAEATGTPLNELIESLDKPSAGMLLFDSVRNALQGFSKILSSIKNAWTETFSLSNTNLLYNLASGIHNLSTKLVMSDETADKLKRTFKGLFSILDLTGRLVGGTLRISFKILQGILGAFDTNILSVTAAIGDAIVKFRNWYREHNLVSKAIEKVSLGLKSSIKYIHEWITRFKETSIIQQSVEKLKTVFEQIFEWFKSSFKESGQRLSDFIDRLKSLDGLTFDNVKSAFKDFKDNVLKFNLSNIIGNIISTLRNFSKKISDCLNVIGNGFANLKDVISDFVEFVASKFSNIGLGEILTVAFGASLIATFITIQKTIKAFKGIAGSISSIFGGISKVLVGYSRKIKSEALKNVAISIAILAASIVVLSKIDKKEVWSSVAALTVLAGGLMGLSVMMGKIGDIKKFSVNIGAIAGAILLLVLALKAIEKLDKEKISYNLEVLGILTAGLVTAISVLGKYAPDLSSGSKMLLAFAISLRLLVGALGKLNDIDPSTKSIGVLIGLMGAIAGLMIITKFAGKHANQAGKSMLGISAALLIMTAVLDKLNKVDVNIETILKLTLIMGAIVGLMAATKLAGDNAQKAGIGMLGVSTSMMVMIKVLEKLNNLDVSVKSVFTLMGIIAAISVLMASTHLAGKNAAKAGVSMLLISVAIGILVGVMTLLSKIDPSGLGRALGAVVVLGSVFAALIAVTKLAGKCKGTLITLTVAVGLLAVALGVLSMINPDGLKNATIAISSVMGMFALMIASTKLAKSAVGSLVTMLAVVAGLATILALMSRLDANASIENAASLSLLLLAMSAAIAIVGNVGKVSNSALASLATIGLVVSELAVILGLMAYLNVEPSIETAASLSLLLLTMSAAMAIAGKIGAVSGSALGSLAVMGLVVGELAVILGLMSHFNVEPSIETAKSLSLLLLSMSGALVILSVVGSLGAGAFIGIGALAVLIAAIGSLMVGIGALIEYVPNVQAFLEKGLPALSLIGEGIGSFFGNIAGGFMEGISSKLPSVGDNLSAFMTSMQPFFESISNITPESVSGVKTLAETMLILAGANFMEGIGSWFTGNSSIDTFGSQIAGFGNAIKEYCAAVSGIDTSGVEASVNAGRALAELAQIIPNSGGLAGFFAGENNIDDFGAKLVPFGNAIKEYCAAVSGIDTSSVEASVTAGHALAELASVLPNSGGVAGFFAGENNIDVFGKKLPAFGIAIKAYGDAVNGINTSGIEASVTAGHALAELASVLPNSGGVAGLFAGGNNIDDFGTRIVAFGNAIKAYGDAVNGINTSGIEASVNAGNALNGLSGSISDKGDNLVSFGKNLEKFGKSLSDFSKSVGNTDTIASGISSLAASLQNLAGTSIDEFVSSFENAGPRVSQAAANLANAVVIGLSSASMNLQPYGFNMGSSVAVGLQSSSGSVASAGSAAAFAGVIGVIGQIGAFLSAGLNLVTGLASGMNSGNGAVNSAGSALGQAGVSGANSQASGFNSVGSYMAAGLASGISGGRASVISAAVSIALSALSAAKAALGIQSPSKVMRDEVGRYIVEGMAEGITSDMSAEEAAEKKAQNIVNAFKEALDRLELQSNISESWFELWKHWEGAEADSTEQMEKQLELLDRKIELQKESVDLAQGEYDTMTSEFGAGSNEAQESLKKLLEEKIELEELYDKQAEASYQHSMNWIETEKEYNRLSLSEEYAAYCRVQSRYKKNSDEWLEMEKKKYETKNALVKASYQNSMDWISKEKEYDRLGKAGELAAYKRVKYQLEEVLAHADELGVDREQITEWLEDTNAQTYSLQKSIYESQKQYDKDLADIRKEDAEKRIEYEEEYKEKCKDVNEQLEQDIKELDDAYADALKSRTKSLYDAYGLFDEVTKKDKVSTSALTKNLQDQVAEFEDWKDQLDSLSAKGLNAALIEELQEMGPSSIAEIRALNSMTDSQLAQYADLWGDKHKLAKERATDELENMRIDTEHQIEQLKLQAQEDLADLNNIWQQQLSDLDKTTNEQIENLTNDFKKEVGLLPEYTEAELNEMVTIANDILSQGNWNELGYNVVMGLVDGVKSAAPTYYDTIAEVLNNSINTGYETVDSHSPSKVFAKLGRYIVEGLAVGVMEYGSMASSAVESVGNDVIGTMSYTVSRINDIVNSDLEAVPTIRPVFDMGGLDSGLSYIHRNFTPERSIALSTSIDSKIQNRNESILESLAGKITAANDMSNTKITDAIGGLRDDFSDLVDKVTNLQMVVDGRALVGAIAPNMDGALGRITKMSRRGVK